MALVAWKEGGLKLLPPKEDDHKSTVGLFSPSLCPMSDEDDFSLKPSESDSGSVYDVHNTCVMNY